MNKILKKVTSFFTELHQKDIKYCHFKSNEHLDAAVSGDTDLDILFEHSRYEEIQRILLSHGFVKFNTAWFVSYPYVEDYIAIDEGKVIHIHAHFKLILGESKVKSYILPWDEEIFHNRVFMDEYGIYASNPIDEMLLLIVRTALKLPNKSINYKNKRDIIDARREFEWLKDRVTKKDIINLAVVKFGNDILHSIEKIYEQNIDYENIKSFYEFAKTELDKNRRYSCAQSKIIKYSRRVVQILAIINRKLNLFTSIKNHRTLDGDGLIVTIMGADGSGKSTQVKKVKEILFKKMDVRYVYMGSGNGPASWHRSILKFGNSLIKRNKKNNESVYREEKKIEKLTIKNILRVIYFISLAIEKRSKLKQLNRFRKKGMICITDRYPQTQVYGYNDGLHMSYWLDSSNRFLRLLANFEYKCYELANEIKPNLVIKLIGDVDVLHNRRAEMTIEEIEKKQNGVKNIEFDNSVEMIELDASSNVDDITRSILDTVGEMIVVKR